MVKRNTSKYETIWEIKYFDPEFTGKFHPYRLELQVNKEHMLYIATDNIHEWLAEHSTELLSTMLQAITNTTMKSTFHFVRIKVVPERLH
jgi:hypothetical protein|tara:strand:+ start:301 stop:570 length:270 start_codon:yes stop_codon:yes gene_type:complete